MSAKCHISLVTPEVVIVFYYSRQVTIWLHLSNEKYVVFLMKILMRDAMFIFQSLQLDQRLTIQ